MVSVVPIRYSVFVMKKILVIDDDEQILEAVKLVLEDEGYLVKTSNQARYIHQLLTEVPDLIILDMLLEDGDGREISCCLKSQPLTQNIPVILFSAHFKGDMHQLLAESRADTFLPKPFDINHLTDLVRNFTTESGRTDTISYNLH